MPFYRFEDMESRRLTAHLSTGMAPIIEGRHLYFCLNQKKAGTGSELHYHPNELLIFVLKGEVNAVVGRAQRIVPTGTFIIIPPNVRHSMRATEDGPCAYLYIKDRTWTVVGIAADEAPPNRPMTMEESEEVLRKGDASHERKNAGESRAIVEGVPNCFFPLSNDLHAAYRYGAHTEWIEGERAAFGYFEAPNNFSLSGQGEPNEQFFYICDGAVNAKVGDESKMMVAGDIAHVPAGSAYELRAVQNARFVVTKPTDYLVDMLTRNPTPHHPEAADAM